MYLEVAVICLFLFWLLFVYFVKHYDYWADRNVPFVTPMFPFGSCPELVLGRSHLTTAIDQVYQQFKQHRFFGIIELRTPVLIITDPNLTKQILSTKFNHFTDRDVDECSSKEYLNHNLLTMRGDEWREMRYKLTPAYTTCKMNMMFCLVKQCCSNLSEAIRVRIESSRVIQVRDLVQRFTVDAIGTCVYGCEVNSLLNENSQFWTVTKACEMDFWFLLKLYLNKAFPVLKKNYLFNLVKPEIRDYVINLIQSTVEYRETNKITRPDFLDLLIKIRQNKDILDEDCDVYGDGEPFKRKHFKSEGMMMEQMAAETYIFFAAGFESVSSLLSFCLYEISCNLSVQEKLAAELNEVLCKSRGKISFQALKAMTYLDQVLNETLRRYPPFPTIERTCTERYKVPESDLLIEEGVRVLIPMYSLHHDPKYFPDPYRFNPDRFQSQNMNQIVPYTFLPYGEGPRMCIGMRFGSMIIKSAIVTVMKDYHMSLSPETPQPLQLDDSSCVLHPSKNLRLVLTPRTH